MSVPSTGSTVLLHSFFCRLALAVCMRWCIRIGGAVVCVVGKELRADQVAMLIGLFAVGVGWLGFVRCFFPGVVLRYCFVSAGANGLCRVAGISGSFSCCIKSLFRRRFFGLGKGYCLLLFAVYFEFISIVIGIFEYCFLPYRIHTGVGFNESAVERLTFAAHHSLVHTQAQYFFEQGAKDFFTLKLPCS